MGVIMGDLLAADLKLHWVIYEDRQGRSRALRDGERYLPVPHYHDFPQRGRSATIPR